MQECWLKPNPRPAVAALSLAAVLAIACIAGLAFAWGSGRTWLAVAALVCAAVCFGFVVLSLNSLRQPRVSYCDGKLFVHDGSSSPHAVPIEVVEVFFLGSGPIKDDGEDAGPRTANVVIRLAEAAKEWHEGKINPLVGKWSEGYIVLRGTWCEPIGHPRLNEMNHRLAEVHRERRQKSTEHPQVTA